ncbi:MAG TPA: hypothetical protein PLM71_05525 [Syntrophorhabdaceae bacterium]|nr:hypothetical protein [Syntrophorhabdaceae bacterium]
MIKQKFSTDRCDTEGEILNEILNFTVERLPKYKWLKENKKIKMNNKEYKQEN